MNLIFSKLIKEVTVAARLGGGDPTGNPRLRAAIQAAKGENMPKDNIERAIKKGSGELEGTSYEEVNYEGYGPGGVALLIDCLTDNKNRTVADIKHIFDRHGGNLGEPGCVAWMFGKKGLIVIENENIDEERLLDVALEAGAEDVKEGETEFEVIIDPADFETVKNLIPGFHDRLGVFPAHNPHVTDQSISCDTDPKVVERFFSGSKGSLDFFLLQLTHRASAAC